VSRAAPLRIAPVCPTNESPVLAPEIARLVMLKAVLPELVRVTDSAVLDLSSV
jgi:hypothetical protein